MSENIEKSYLEEQNFSPVTIAGIISNIKDLKICAIRLMDKKEEKYNDKNSKIEIITDLEHPLVLGNTYINGEKILYINPEWYKNNKELIDELLCYIAKNTRVKTLYIINGSLINEKFKSYLCENENLISVRFGGLESDNYVITKSDYYKFLNSNIELVFSVGIEDNLKQLKTFHMTKEQLSVIQMIGIDTKTILINDSLTNNELKNIINDNSNFNISFSQQDIPRLEQVVKLLKPLNKNNKIIINVSDKNKFNEVVFNNDIEYENIYINASSSELKLEDYLKNEKLLYLMIEPAKNLSPFEKYIYAYNITKLFKKYKDSSKVEESRSLYEILNNEYIVCAGYSNLFGDLLDKLGIKNHYLLQYVDTSYDQPYQERELFGERKVTTKEGHARRYCHIVDSKYGIDGFYLADPTWDSRIEKEYFTDVDYDFYNHLAFTDREATDSSRYLWVDVECATELFDITSIQEFYDKINFLLKRTKRTLSNIIKELIMRLELLDLNYINNLKKKYTFINDKVWPKDFTNLIYDLGSYILTKVNKPISSDIIMKAVEVIYRHSYGYKDEDINDVMEIIRDMNGENQCVKFPERYKIHGELISKSNKF